ncbi:hypothetical protein OCK74_18400 [Chitinophagaceae bacterium LB-8]|uniref:Uncharacterized protein n=1 Tax=Paraflavisolibacter caeni TaxID=2982496 RepID=A0A9X2XYG0_9BACT|nr:hypothetical protein [Paraflavisolibacter caeni]MCU7551097.1 hypothetical protein [Paraflavisolibacter caeni]
MKKLLYTVCILLLTASASFAQDDDGDKISGRMTEYIQRRLGLSKAEAERFQPVFFNYYNDLKRTTRENKDDKLVLQQKVTELRVRYRDQFKPIVGDKRSNDVFAYERDFVDEVKKIRMERMQNRNHNLSDKRLGGPLQE